MVEPLQMIRAFILDEQIIRFPEKGLVSYTANWMNMNIRMWRGYTAVRCSVVRRQQKFYFQMHSNLIEMDFGDFEGKTADELVKQDAFLQWLKGGADCRPPKGESLEEVQLRIFKALREIIRDMMNTDILHAAVITHAGILSNLIAGFGLPKIDPKELRPAPGEGYDVLVTASLWQRSGAFEVLGMTPYRMN